MTTLDEVSAGDKDLTARFPDCVFMKLHCQVLTDQPQNLLGRLRGSGNPADPKGITLGLTISFSGEQKIDIPAGVGARLGFPRGQASFGIRKGSLRFELVNCKLPLEKTELFQPFRVSMEVERQENQSETIGADVKTGSATASVKQSQASSEKVREEVFQVIKIGSEESPAWVFEAYGERKHLVGILKEASLGILDIDSVPCTVRAELTARGEDIRLTRGKLGLTENITLNKRAFIERYIALRIIKPMIESAPLCQVRWHHG